MNARARSVPPTAIAYIAVSGVGAVHSLRRGRLARFLGVRLPGPPLAQALTVGTPLSAPPVMLIALALAARRHRNTAVLILSVMFLLGVAGEPDTLQLIRRPTRDPVGSTCAAFEVALPAAMLCRAMRARRIS